MSSTLLLKRRSLLPLILEIYDKGNLILTDHKYKILALLRSHRYDEETKVAVGHVSH